MKIILILIFFVDLKVILMKNLLTDFKFQNVTNDNYLKIHNIQSIYPKLLMADMTQAL